MIEESVISSLISEMGFPIVVAIILLYDKIKSNGSLRKAVENNTELLYQIKRHFGDCDGRRRTARKRK